MKPCDLLRRLARLSRVRAWDFSSAEGANHTKVMLNGRRTVIPRHRGDMKTGTYRAILKQLGLTPEDLED